MLHVLMEKWTLGYSFMLKCGKYSYEIFLFQMIVFNFVHKEWFSFVELRQLQFVIWFVFVNFMSVIPVVLLKSFMEKRKKNVV